MSRVRSGRVLAWLGAAVVLLGTFAPVAPARADFDLTVLWPTATAINPITTSYSVTISDTGPGHLYAVWRGSWQPLEHSGVQVVEFATQGSGQVLIYRCVAVSCGPTGAASQPLRVYSSVMATAELVTPPTSPGSAEVLVHVDAWGTGDPWLIEWDLLAGPTMGSDVLSSGSASVPELGEFGVVVPTAVPGGLVDEIYGLRFTASADLGTGDLSSTPIVIPVVVDSTPPVVTATASVPVLYPYSDGFRDQVVIEAAVDEPTMTRVLLVDSAGVDVGVLARTPQPRRKFRVEWRGRVASQRVVAGTYSLRIEATDLAGNQATVAIPLVVADDAAKWQTTTLVATAERTMKSVSVGSCSSLASPSSHGWSGSQGYLSQSKCTRTGDGASVVSAVHQIRLPPAAGDNYASFRVDVYGGAARGRASAALSMAYLKAGTDEPGSRTRSPGSVGWHLGKGAEVDAFLRASGGRFAVRWVATASRGSQYDIRAFRVTVRHRVLVAPSRIGVES